MTSYQIPYPADDAALKALVDRLVKRGWYAKGYFYPIDEPVNKQAYETLAAISDRLRRCAPGYRWVVPFYRGPDWDSEIVPFDLMANRVNPWCPISSYFDAGATRATLARRHRLGDGIAHAHESGPFDDQVALHDAVQSVRLGRDAGRDARTRTEPSPASI